MLPQLYAAAEAIVDEPTPDGLRKAVLDENILARPSISARTKVYEKLQQRYLPPSLSTEWPALLRALKREGQDDQKALIAYVALSANEPLFRTLNLRWLVPGLRAAGREVDVSEVLQAISSLERDHLEVKRWGDSTRLSLAQHYLAALRDFGFARGVVRKRLARPHVGARVVFFACELLLGRGVAPRELLQHDLVRVLGLDLAAAIEALDELDRLGAMRFRAQGGIVELEVMAEEARP